MYRISNTLQLIDRRAFCGGLILAGCGCHAALGQPRFQNCFLNDEQVQALLGASAGSGTSGFSIDDDDVQNGSGNKNFDRALAHTLVMVGNCFDVLPGFAFFDDQDSPNAYASPSKRLGRPDGSVVFGLNMFKGLMVRPERPEVCVAAICAHEFGHIAQNKAQVRTRLVGPSGKVKRLELHADYLAGYYAGFKRLENISFPAAVFATTMFSFGDSDFGNVGHHGTQKERGDALVAGHDAAFRQRLDFKTALEAGVQYVLQTAE
jgi:hypothetical protein